MAKNAFIIHGLEGHPEENWFPWLKTKLEALGCPVFIPQFPTPEGQTLENWLAVFTQCQKHLNKESLLIGHSLGAPFLLNILEKYPAHAAFFVGGYCNLPENQPTQNRESFIQKPFKWEQIKAHCPKFFIFHSDNDPFIPLEKAEELAKNLDVAVTLVKGAGHFNQAAGYTQFDLLFDKIKSEL